MVYREASHQSQLLQAHRKHQGSGPLPTRALGRHSGQRYAERAQILLLLRPVYRLVDGLNARGGQATAGAELQVLHRTGDVRRDQERSLRLPESRRHSQGDFRVPEGADHSHLRPERIPVPQAEDLRYP